MMIHRWARWAAPALAAGLLVTACGSSTGSTGQNGAQASGTSAFQQCLRQHGVTLPSGRPSFSGTPSPGAGVPSPGAGVPSPGASVPAGGGQFPGGFGNGAGSKAFQACRKYAPAGFGRGQPGAGGLSALSAFTSCMKQHGVTLTGGPAALQSLSRASGKVKKAFQACRALLPQGVPTATPSG
jgi:hypothetical protein